MRRNHRDRFKTTLFFIIMLSSFGYIKAQQETSFINHIKNDLNINSRYFIKLPWDKELLAKETSMLTNVTLEKVTHEHYKNLNANKPTISTTTTIRRGKEGRGVGTKFQEGGTFDFNAAGRAFREQERAAEEGGSVNYDRGRARITERRAARSAETTVAAQKAEQLKVNILTYGTIGLVSLFFVMATTTFCILYIRRNKNNPQNIKKT